jgi:L-alanine-DL-glutamate epimerase-like enolase superfamily enzyme
MKITEIDFYLCHHPLPAPFMPSWIPGFPQHNNSCLVCVVKTDEGIEGYSAMVGFLDESRGLVGMMRPFMVGRDPTRIENIVQVIRSAHYLGYKAFFIEVAMWDILGKKAGLPIYKLLGGGTGIIKAYASSGEIQEPKKRLDYIKQIKDMGFKAVKLRIRSMEFEKDIAIVESVRAAVGDDFDIMVDANQGWPIHLGLVDWPRWDLKRAMRTAAALEDLNVRWIEEPLFKHDYDGMAALRASTTIPIAGGEFNTDLYEFRDLIGGGCLDIVQPDVTLAGGILMGKKIAGMAEAANLQFSPHTWTNGLGLAANLQLMGSVHICPYCEFPFEPPGWVPEARDFMLTEPFTIDNDGFIHVPDKPGLGVELDMEKIKAHGEKL